MKQPVLTPTGLLAFGRRLPCTIGRGGILPGPQKAEGDGATPTGRLTITGCRYRPDRMAPPVPWAQPILPGDLWSDDPGDDAYNHFTRAPYAPSHEKLRRADPLYNLVLTTDWNWPDAIPGRGSAIFLHRWRRRGYPTAGCIAMAPADLLWLTRQLVPGDAILIPDSLAPARRR